MKQYYESLYLPIELYQIILEQSDFIDQIHLTMVNKYMHQNLKIKDFYHIDYTLINKLNDDILKQYPYITKLNISSNQHVRNINHLKFLKSLKAGRGCYLDDQGVTALNLEELDVSYGFGITDVNHMTNLKILCAKGFCGLSDMGIRNINLIKLIVSHNIYITDVNHMTNLEILEASGFCAINNNGIKDLIKLKELYMADNSRITGVKHIKNLKILNSPHSYF